MEKDRKRDELWDSLVVAFGEPKDTNSRGQRNRACRILREKGADPARVPERCRYFRIAFPEATLTPLALAKWWSQAEMEARASGRLALTRLVSEGGLQSIAHLLGKRA